MNSFKRKVLVSFMAMALCLTTVFGTSTTTEAATSKKAVKSVTLKVNSKKVNSKTITLTQGKSTTVKVTVNPSSAKKSITYKSSNKKIATISSKGKIKGVKAGTATMTVTVKGKNNKTKKASFKVKVKPVPTKKPTKVPTKKPTAVPTKAAQQPTEMSLEASATAIAPGQTSQLYPKFVPANTTAKVSYKSLDTTVATVDANGTVKGLTEGTATIVATTANGLSATLTIKVAKVAPTSMKLNVSALTMTIGEGNQTLSPQFPEGTTQTEVTWKSSDETVVSVDATGKLVAKKAGKATITATSVADSSITATCEVTVKSETNTRTDGVTIEVANALDGYENTVFTGTNADIRVRLYKEGKPVANTDVTLKMQYKSGEYNNKKCDYWEISNEHSASSTVKTDAQGIATFTIALKNGYDFKANDGVMSGYLLTATATGASTEAQTALRFARFSVGEYTGVANTYNYSFADISVNNLATNLVQGENAAKVGLDSTETVKRMQINKEEDKNELIGTSEYVVSQQVSTKGTSDHAVTFNAAPLIEYPEVITGTSDDDYKQEVNYSTQGYSIYDTSKSTVIKKVPTNLNYATLNFANVTISKNTALKIKVYTAYDEVTDTFKKDDLLETYAIKGEHIEDNFGFQVPIQDLMKKYGSEKVGDFVYIRVYVESEGQVEVAKAIGFDLVNITGNYVGTAKYNNLSEIYKDAKINWTSVTTGKIGQDAYKYSNFQNSVEMDETTAKNYGIDTTTEGETYYNAKVTYRVPTYPHLGNAIVTVKKPNSNEAITYFMIPTYADNNENKLIDSAKVKAFEISTEEATNYGVNVNVTSNDRAVTINTEKAGVSEVYGELQVGSELSYLTKEEKRLFAYVEWAPIPTKPEKNPTDFYTLVGQSISVDVLVKDDNNNIVRGQEVKFYLGDDKGEKLVPGIRDGVTISKDATKYDKDSDVVMTNDNGIARMTFKSDSYKHGILSKETPLFAKCDGYNVTMSVKGTVAEYARLFWIAPGLRFTDQTAVSAEEVKETVGMESTKTTVFETDNSDATSESATTQEKNVNTTWLLGYQVVGLWEDKVKANAAEAAKDNYSNVIINGADTELDLNGSGTDEASGKMVEGTLDTRKSCVQLTSSKPGTDILTASLTGASIDESAVTFSFTDSEGNVIKTVPNVGDEEASVSVSLNVPIKWVTSDVHFEIYAPSGNDHTIDAQLNKGEDKVYDTVYIKATDGQGNIVPDGYVNYIVKDSATQAVITQANKVALKNGYVAVKYLLPTLEDGKACTYDIQATVSGNATVRTSVSYKTKTNTTADFGIKYVTGKLDGNAIKIELKLSEAVNPETVVKDMFEIRDENKDRKEIQSISVNGSVITMTINPVTFKYLNITYTPVEENLAKGLLARRMVSKTSKVAMKTINGSYVVSGYYNTGVDYTYTKDTGTVKAKVPEDLYAHSYVVFAYGDSADALNHLETVEVGEDYTATCANAAKAKFVKVYVAGEESEVYQN